MSLLNYQDYLIEVYGNDNKTKSFRHSLAMNEVFSNASKMSINEANEILESLDLPTNIREYIERESRGSYSFEPKVTEGKIPLVNFIPMIDTTLNENESWVNLNEEDKHKMETVLWEAIYDYITTDVVNEGLFSFISRGFTALVDGGIKAIKAGWALVTGIGKLLKSAIQTTVAGAKKVFKWAVGYGKSLVASYEKKAEDRCKRLTQHGEEQVEKDTKDFGDTVGWFTGKAPDEALSKGEGEAAGVAKEAIAASEEERGKAEEVLQKATAEVKRKGAKNENRSFTKQATLVLEELQKLTFNESYEFYATAILLGLTEGKETLNESEQFDFVLSHPLDEKLKNKISSFMSVNEGIWDKVTNFFGFGDDEEDEKDKEETDMMKAKEDELNQKDAEKLKNAKQPPTPDGNPANKAEEKAKKAEEEAQDDGWGIGKAIKAVCRVLLQGPVYLVEWVVENGLSKGLKFFSACVKKLGGPGVFLFITLAAAAAILIGLAVEAIVASGVLGEHSTFAKFFHMGALGSTLHWLEHIAEHAATALAKQCIPILKWIPVGISIYMAWGHIKHILHDAKMGKNIDHSKAIEQLEKQNSEIDKELDETDNKELQQLLADKQDIIQKQVKFHKDMRELKVELKEIDKKLADEKTYLKATVEKSGQSDSIEKIIDLEDNIKGNKAQIKEREKGLEEKGIKGNPEKEKQIKAVVDKLKANIADTEKRIKELKDKVSSSKNDEGDDQYGKKSVEAHERIKKLEHELHEKEHKMKHDFDHYYEDGGPKDEIKKINDKIKEEKKAMADHKEASEMGENVSTIKSYKKFVNEAKFDDTINEYDSIMDSLRNSFINERSSLRRQKIEEENNAWIKNNFSFEMDEEFDSFVDGSWLKNQKVSESKVNEHWIDFGPALKVVWKNIKRKYSGFQTGLVGTWKEWNYLQELPKEVSDKAKELKAGSNNVHYFDDVDNPDAYEYLLKELPSLNVKYVEGEYTNRMDNKVKFVLVVE